MRDFLFFRKYGCQNYVLFYNKTKVRENISFKEKNMQNETYKVLKRISDESYTPELVYLQNAPGSGKSHALTSIIAENLKNSTKQSEIWVYLTTDKKNRDNEYQHIKQLVPECNEQILLIKSDIDCILEYFSALTKLGKIPPRKPMAEKNFVVENFLANIDRNNCPSTYELLNEIIPEFYNTKAGYLDEHPKEQGVSNTSIKVSDKLNQRFSQLKISMYRDFKTALKQVKQKHKKQDKSSNISSEEKNQLFTKLFPWYKDVFPSLSIQDNYRCIVMTAQKYFYPFRTIESQSQTLLDLFRKKHVNLILDEADQIKQIWLDEIIDSIAPKDGRNYSYEDIFIIFKRIWQSLNGETNQLPSDLIKDDKSKRMLKKVKQRFTDLAEKYHLNANIQVDSELNQDSNHFIFNYGDQNLTINNSRKTESLMIVYDQDRQVNLIRKVDDTAKLGKTEIVYLDKVLRQIKDAIVTFLNETSKIAIQYHEFKRQRNEALKDNHYPLMEHREEHLYVLRTLISNSNPEEDRWHEYLLKNFFENRPVRINLKAHDPFTDDISMYNHGFSYYNIITNPEKEARSHVYLFSQQKTPEKMLAEAANNWRVFMISATVNNKSSFANFDRDWLENVVPKIRTLNSKDEKLLNDANNQRLNLYQKNIKTNIKLVTLGDPIGTVESFFKKWIKKYKSDLSLSTIRNLLIDYTEIDSNFSLVSDLLEEQNNEAATANFMFLRHLKTLMAIIQMCRLNQKDSTEQSFVIYRNAKISPKILNWFKEVLQAINLNDYADTLIPIEARIRLAN